MLLTSGALLASRYDVLTKGMLDAILRRRGRLPESSSAGLVFTRMRVASGGAPRRGPSVSANGAGGPERVNYDLVDPDRVPWGPAGGGGPGSGGGLERQETVPRRPQGTVATVSGHAPAGGRGVAGGDGGGRPSRGVGGEASGRATAASSPSAAGRPESRARSSDPGDRGGATTGMSVANPAVSLGGVRPGPVTPTAEEGDAAGEVDGAAARRAGRSGCGLNLNLRKVFPHATLILFTFAPLATYVGSSLRMLASPCRRMQAFRCSCMVAAAITPTP